MMQHQSVCVFLSEENETEQGLLQYQRPPSPVRCWAHREWKSLMLFCYQLSSVSLQMNCWYRLMSYNPSPLFCCRFLAASVTMLAPSVFVWQGHTTLQSRLICLFICITDGLSVPKLVWPWGDGKVTGHWVDVDHYWVNREATHRSLMLPFIFPSNILPSCGTCRRIKRNKWDMARGEERARGKWQRDDQIGGRTWRTRRSGELWVRVNRDDGKFRDRREEEGKK